MSQTSNHLDAANQTSQNQGGSEGTSGKAKPANQNQHIYQNVTLQLEAGSKSDDHNPELQLADQNQDQRPANQEQPIANQVEQPVDQNEEPQAVADPNQAQVIAERQQQPADQNQAQAPDGGADQELDTEKAKIPYGVVTIHSDQSNTPTDNNNYAEVRNETDENIRDATYDRVNDNSEINDESGYSTVVRDKPTQQRPQRDRMYESVDEAFDRKTKDR